MPTPPKEGETREQFVSRCMSFMHKEKSDRPKPQQVAICFSMWRKAHPKDKGAQPKE
jgi:hypothetical protein